MRRELSSLDLIFLLGELRFLTGGLIQKVYQDKKSLRLEIYIPEKGGFELYFEPGKIFVTDFKRKSLEYPESFCMFLRKHVQGQRIVEIRQPDFERIIEIETEKNILIFELFSKGNIILCDKMRIIMMPLEVQLWKDRQIIPKKPYQYPPSISNPFKISEYELKKMLMVSKKSIVTFLAVDLSLSGIYAEEVCSRANIEKNKVSDKLNEKEMHAIHESIQNLLKNFGPQIVLDEKKPIDAVPFDMKIYEGKEIQRVTTFNHALDEFFTEKEIITKEIKEEKVAEKEVQKFQRIVGEQKEALEKWKLKEKNSRERAEAINKNFELVERILAIIQKARDQGMSWDEIRERIEKEDSPETRAIKEIREDEGIIVLELS